MLYRFNRMPLSVQFRLLVILVALMGALMALLLLGRAYIANAQSRARTIANLVEDVGQLTGREGLSASDARTLDGVSGGFHLTRPASIQRDRSEVANTAGHSIRFRMVSDKFVNPADAPTRFELAAIETLRESGGVEVSEIKGDRLMYARRLTATPACMACHDSYGFKPGEVAGVLSVSVPIVEGGSGLFESLGAVAWVGIAAFLAALSALLWFVQSAVIAPVRRLSRSAGKASESDIADIRTASLRFTPADETSRNEVQCLGVAIKRLLRSLKVQGKY